jgi:hypothetical protein
MHRNYLIKNKVASWFYILSSSENVSEIIGNPVVNLVDGSEGYADPLKYLFSGVRQYWHPSKQFHRGYGDF